MDHVTSSIPNISLSISTILETPTDSCLNASGSCAGRYFQRRRTRYGVALKAYVNGDCEYLDFVNEHHHPKWCRTRMDNVNHHFRQEGKHRYAYDYETFELVLGRESVL
jgi:hypothetical protein